MWGRLAFGAGMTAFCSTPIAGAEQPEQRTVFGLDGMNMQYHAYSCKNMQLF
jgi:hypothetical protein